MKFITLFSVAALLAAPLTAPTAALAHTKVVASTPAQGASVKAPRSLTLTFSEALLPPTAAAPASSIASTSCMSSRRRRAHRGWTNSQAGPAAAAISLVATGGSQG